jgi:hypothetical protein
VNFKSQRDGVEAKHSTRVRREEQTIRVRWPPATADLIAARREAGESVPGSAGSSPARLGRAGTARGRRSGQHDVEGVGEEPALSRLLGHDRATLYPAHRPRHGVASRPRGDTKDRD